MDILKKALPVHTVDGENAALKRIMPTHNLSYVDPFLMMDHFSLDQRAGFPDHPHRGFEIITYMLEGAFKHADSAGNEGIIQAGGLQRITAGRGIVHSEFPAFEGINSGIQLWINLERRLKGMEPSYQDVKREEIPERESDGIRVRTLVGEGSPVRIVQSMVYYDIAISQGKKGLFPIPGGFQPLIYILEGTGSFGGNRFPGTAGEVLIPERAAENGGLSVVAEEDLRFVLIAGQPIGERPVFRGSFVD
ncbi:pirin family protein [Thermicanus aegyptius]|uniref:pirin family protein n=1 Tax=Thermicanus aegyptius TaxID=94009 RepID=UPI0004166A53|nr:pirin family protein [Thermicanus aegyptius]